MEGSGAYWFDTCEECQQKIKLQWFLVNCWYPKCNHQAWIVEEEEHDCND